MGVYLYVHKHVCACIAMYMHECICAGMYVCVNVHVCTAVHTHMYVNVCGGQRSMLGVFPNHSAPYCLRRCLSSNPELSDLARLSDQQAPVILLNMLPNTGFTGMLQHAQLFLFGAGDLKSGPRCCTVNTLST